MNKIISNDICPNCQSKVSNIYINTNGWQVLKCEKCNLCFTGRQIDESKKIVDFYDSNYIVNYERREKVLKSRFREYLEIVEKYLNGGNLLDVGCGMGYFLQIAGDSKNYKWNIFGVEPNSRLIKKATGRVKKRILVGDLSKLPYQRDQFDCVTCFDVLEHDINFHRSLSEIKRVLKKRGVLIIQAPNYQSLMAHITGSQWDWWATPDHVLHFSVSFLVNHLEKNGFTTLYKYTYERSQDYLLNIKSKFRKNIITKIIYFCLIPILLLSERIAWRLNYGGLLFIVARKN